MSRILPHRRFSRGTKPGVTGAGPIGPSTGDELQWVFPSVELTSLDKKKIFSEVMRLAVENMFSTHCYTFAGKFYRQTEGGTIGLHNICASPRSSQRQ